MLSRAVGGAYGYTTDIGGYLGQPDAEIFTRWTEWAALSPFFRIQKGLLDGAFVVVDKNGVRTHIPIGGVSCLMLEIGTRISHAAVRLAAQVGT